MTIVGLNKLDKTEQARYEAQLENLYKVTDTDLKTSRVRMAIFTTIVTVGMSLALGLSGMGVAAGAVAIVGTGISGVIYKGIETVQQYRKRMVADIQKEVNYKTENSHRV